MTDKPGFEDYAEGDDTLIVAPPNFRERVQAAQKAKTSEIRQSVEIPNPLLKKAEEPAALAAEPPIGPDGKP
jgi:hypothetical protein